MLNFRRLQENVYGIAPTKLAEIIKSAAEYCLPEPNHGDIYFVRGTFTQENWLAEVKRGGLRKGHPLLYEKSEPDVPRLVALAELAALCLSPVRINDPGMPSAWRARMALYLSIVTIVCVGPGPYSKYVAAIAVKSADRSGHVAKHYAIEELVSLANEAQHHKSLDSLLSVIDDLPALRPGRMTLDIRPLSALIETCPSLPRRAEPQ